MNGLLILLLSALVLAAGYWLYGRCIERSWGVDPAAATPAVRRRDGRDFVATRSWVLLIHAFVSVCAVLVVFGPVEAARYGWLPVLAWILLGGVLIGGVQEYCVLYVSVKSRGLTLGGLFEKFTGLRWKKVFLAFAWLVCVVAIAALTDIAARTLDGFAGVEETDPLRGRAGTVLLLLYVFALLTGLAGRYSKISAWGTRAITVTILICATMLGMLFPVALRPSLWHVIILSFALLSAAAPVWLTLHPRAHLHTLLYGLLLLAVLAGLVAGRHSMTIPAWTGFAVEGRSLYPWLFVTVTCGAVSGLQALTASNVISRQIGSEPRIRRIGFGAVMLECFVAVIALVCVGTRPGASAFSGDPGALFLSAVGSVLSGLGIPAEISGSFYILLIACLCIGALETLARAARVCWQEFFDYGDEEPSFVRYAAANGWVGAGVTLLAALLLCRIGYSAVWPLFGTAVQTLSGLALLICAVWLRSTRRNAVWVLVPMVFMLLVSMTALILTVIESAIALAGGSAHLIADIFRIVLSLAIFVTTVLLCYQGFRRLFEPERAPED